MSKPGLKLHWRQIGVKKIVQVYFQITRMLNQLDGKINVYDRLLGKWIVYLC